MNSKSKNEYSICLNMIVRDESHVIEKTLKNVDVGIQHGLQVKTMRNC